MIRHVVAWTMAGETAEDRRASAVRIRDALEALPASIPQIRRLEVGLDLRDKPSNWDLVLTVDLDDLEALAAYRAHPDHVVVGDVIASLERTRMCVDYEV